MARRDDLARDRISKSKDAIRDTLARCESGDLFGVETCQSRILRRLQARFGLAPAAAEALLQDADHSDEAREALQGDTFDLVSVSFLERGARVARSVGRISTLHGSARGTGFLVGAGLILTNNHVILNPVAAAGMMIEFNFEHDLIGQLRTVTSFRLDPSVFLFSPEDKLDYTLVAVGPRHSGPGTLAEFGYSGLSDADDKHIIGEIANIVQHPQGRPKEIAVQQNRLVNRLQHTLHYVTDTQKGSSGAPVYNSQWQAIALHHWGSPWIDRPKDGPREINEGVRISRIVKDIKDQLPALNPEAKSRVQQMLELGQESWRVRHDTIRPDEASLALGPSGDLDRSMLVPVSGHLKIGTPVNDLATPHTGSGKDPVIEERDKAPSGDDLTQIKGIGSVFAARLQQRGITEFAQIARWPRAQAERMDRLLDARGSVLRDKWRDQARQLIK